MARPEPKFWSIVMWLSERGANVDAFQDLVRRGLPSTKDHLHRNVGEFLDWLLSKPEMFRDEAGRKRLGDPKERSAFVETMVAGHFSNASHYLSAASLIFAHSIAEETVKACERLAKRIDPAGYRALPPAPGKKKLPARVGKLVALCTPPGAQVLGYAFDPKRLEDLDQLRHDVVHGHKMGDPLSVSDGDLEFLRKTGTYGLLLIFEKYKDRMKPEHLGQLPLPGSAGDAADSAASAAIGK